jgi:DNA-directed RNA polymerase subunit RPC12/RpoP
MSDVKSKIQCIQCLQELEGKFTVDAIENPLIIKCKHCNYEFLAKLNITTFKKENINNEQIRQN